MTSIYQIISDDEFRDVYITTHDLSLAQNVLNLLDANRSQYSKYKINVIKLDDFVPRFTWLYWPDEDADDSEINILPYTLDVQHYIESGAYVVWAESEDGAREEFKTKHGIEI